MKKLTIILIIVLISCSKQAIELPRAYFTINLTKGTTKTIFILKASESTGKQLQFKVDWGCKFTEYTINPIFENKYSKTGEFLVTLRVKDFRGWTDDYKQKIEIK